jgi:hypothetical protein
VPVARGGGRYPRDREAGHVLSILVALALALPGGRDGGRLLRRSSGTTRTTGRSTAATGRTRSTTPAATSRPTSSSTRPASGRAVVAQTRCGSGQVPTSEPGPAARARLGRHAGPGARHREEEVRAGAAGAQGRPPPRPDRPGRAASLAAGRRRRATRPGALIALLVAAAIALALALAWTSLVHGLEPGAPHEAAICGVSVHVGPRSAGPLALQFLLLPRRSPIPAFCSGFPR